MSGIPLSDIVATLKYEMEQGRLVNQPYYVETEKIRNEVYFQVRSYPEGRFIFDFILTELVGSKYTYDVDGLKKPKKFVDFTLNSRKAVMEQVWPVLKQRIMDTYGNA